MALTKVINDLADLNQSGSTNALKGCAGTTAQQPVSSSTIEYVIVGGGGGGATNGSATGDGLGGGGAGGYLTGSTTVYKGTPTVLTIGKGGAGGSTTNGYDGINGDDSGFNGIRAIGGGGGGAGTAFGIDGGSGGGGGRNGGAGGSSLNSQGNDGGTGGTGSTYYNSTGAGGGGSGEPFLDTNGTGGNGANSPSGAGGSGGSGTNINTFISSTNSTLAQIGDISGSDVYVAGGGGGGAYSGTKGTGGSGGGGTGGQSGTNATNGIDNTGGGGGGDGSALALGADGGSGVAILKYDNTKVTGYTLNSEDTYTANWPADKFGVGYWPLNLNVNEISGHYNSTVLVGSLPTYVTGKFNQAAKFTTSDGIDTGFWFPTDKTFTMCVWIKNDSWYSGFASIIGKMYTAGSYPGAAIIQHTGLAYFSYNGTTTASSYTLPVGEWVHLGITYDGGTSCKFYANGVLQFDDTATPGNAHTTNFVIGDSNIWVGTQATMEQVRVYTSELAASDMLNIYNNSKPGTLPPLSSTAPTIDSLSFPSGVTTKALWDFNGDLIADPTTYNGSITSSISYATGKFTTDALYFNGVGGGLISTNYTRSGSNFTASLWVNLLDRNGRQLFLGDGDSGGADWSISITMQITWPGDVLKVFINSADGVSAGSSVTTHVDWNKYWGKWTHVAVTQNGGAVKVYVNGILVDTLTVSGSNILSGSAAQPIALGSWGPAANNNGETYGSINLMRFYDVTLTDQNIYDLWQKETNIQTHFTSGSTDTLVFKEGSGEITFTGDPEPGADIGMLRYNSTLGQMEHFNSSGWKDFTNCTTSMCNYPTTAAALYQFANNCNDTCGVANGTPNSITYTSYGKYGQAGFFNGSGYVQIPYNFDFSGSFAISCWIRPNTVSNQWQSIIGTDGYGAATHDGFNFYMNYAVLEPWIGGVSGSGDVFQTGSVTVGVWQHLVLSRTYNSKWELFYNGSSLGTNTSLGLTWDLTSQGASYIGIHPTSFTYQFNGDIDQVRIFTTDLTAAQVTQLYNEIYCP